MADEIVACSNALGDGVRKETASLFNGVRSPNVACALSAVFLDFEPHGAVGRQFVLAS